MGKVNKTEHRIRYADGANLESVKQFIRWADAYWHHGPTREGLVNQAYTDFHNHLSTQALVQSRIDPLMTAVDRLYRERILPYVLQQTTTKKAGPLVTA